jgi:hypothetical protein
MTLLVSLCRANQGILKQKMGLMEALLRHHGPAIAHSIYQTTCPIVKASIGQHIRHSMDHMEHAVRAALYPQHELHYDRRERGGADENHWDAAYDRLRKIASLIDDLGSTASDAVTEHPVGAMFMLSGDADTEFRLHSTVARELGFAAHHAIHHLAMVKIIAINEVGKLKESDLPPDFGRAPSTVNFDHSLK